MTREEAIQTISDLFPADAPYPETAAIGRELLEQAKREVNGWRTEPTEVLVCYARLCINKEQAQFKKFQDARI